MLKQAMESIRRAKLKDTLGRDPVYLALIRRLPCLKCGVESRNEAAHVRMQSGTFGKHGGIGTKPADRWAVPLCAGCHRNDSDSQHRLGEREFWGRLGINPVLVCHQLYGQRGDFVAMLAIILDAIAEHGQRP